MLPHSDRHGHRIDLSGPGRARFLAYERCRAHKHVWDNGRWCCMEKGPRGYRPTPLLAELYARLNPNDVWKPGMVMVFQRRCKNCMLVRRRSERVSAIRQKRCEVQIRSEPEWSSMKEMLFINAHLASFA